MIYLSNQTVFQWFLVILWDRYESINSVIIIDVFINFFFLMLNFFTSNCDHVSSRNVFKNCWIFFEIYRNKNSTLLLFDCLSGKQWLKSAWAIIKSSTIIHCSEIINETADEIDVKLRLKNSDFLPSNRSEI